MAKPRERKPAITAPWHPEPIPRPKKGEKSFHFSCARCGRRAYSTEKGAVRDRRPSYYAPDPETPGFTNVIFARETRFYCADCAENVQEKGFAPPAARGRRRAR